MFGKKKAKHNKNIFSKVLALAAIWIVVIFMFVLAAFSFGMKQATSFYMVKSSNEIKMALDSKRIASAQENPRNVYLRNLFDKAEAYIRSNLVSIVEANNAGDDKVQAGDICFINDNRALVFYRSDDKDRYLAELVFGEDNGQIKINRFILKVKNDTDYSRGVYGAD